MGKNGDLKAVPKDAAEFRGTALPEYKNGAHLRLGSEELYVDSLLDHSASSLRSRTSGFGTDSHLVLMLMLLRF